MKKGWYSETSMDGTSGVFEFDPKFHEPLKSEHSSDYRGPFPTYKKAKRDAIEYWRACKTTAQIEINKINAIKFPGTTLKKKSARKKP